MKTKLSLKALIFVTHLGLSSCTQAPSKIDIESTVDSSSNQSATQESSPAGLGSMNANLSKEEQIIASKIIKSASSIGNSAQGNWLVFVSHRDRQLLSGNIIQKLKVVGSNQSAGEEIKSSDINPDEVVYIGLMKIEGNNGFDIVTNNFNAIERYSGFSISGNALSWSTDSPAGKDGKFGKGMGGNRVLKETKANYDPSKDLITGKTNTTYTLSPMKKTKSGYLMKAKGNNKFEPVFDEKASKAKIQAGSYLWKAIRISDSDFARLSKPGIQNSFGITQYVVSLNLADKRVANELGK